MKKRLVILTTHFGTNFSGGSTATCEIFSRLEDQFREVVVIGTRLGEHPFKNIRFIRYNNWLDAINKLRMESEDSVFYGDFYNSFLFILAKVPFYFTYHDNWPELAYAGINNRLKSIFYTNIYHWIFRKATRTITVSQFKLEYIHQFSPSAQIIYNGFNETTFHQSPKSNITGKKRILMVGNIDQRKYRMALRLFKSWSLGDEVQVDIFGNFSDKEVSFQLSQFPFVKMVGFVNPIPYSSYSLLLHTSVMENLPIVFCEALHHNVPVVAFDVGGCKEIIKDDSGFLIAPYELKQMENAVKKVLDSEFNSPSNEILKRHNWNQASSQYQQILTHY